MDFSTICNVQYRNVLHSHKANNIYICRKYYHTIHQTVFKDMFQLSLSNVHILKYLYDEYQNMWMFFYENMFQNLFLIFYFFLHLLKIYIYRIFVTYIQLTYLIFTINTTQLHFRFTHIMNRIMDEIVLYQSNQKYRWNICRGSLVQRLSLNFNQRECHPVFFILQ